MKIVIVDDDTLVSMSLKTILNHSPQIEVLAVGGNGLEGIALYEEHRPDILLMDIRMEVMSGLEAAEKILSTHPDARILFLTTFSDDEYITQALSIGAKGYILKQNFEGIAPALESVLQGQTVFGEKIMTKIPDLMNTQAPFDYEKYQLTQKEFEIIQLVAEGLSNKEIAQHSFLSEGTVRNYLSVILDKLQLRDRTQLAVFYYKNGKSGR